jgi:hypothetical protein
MDPQCPILETLVEELAFRGMPLLFHTYHHVDGPASKILPRAESVLCFAPHEKGAQVWKSEYLVEAENNEIWGCWGVA